MYNVDTTTVFLIRVLYLQSIPTGNHQLEVFGNNSMIETEQRQIEIGLER